MGPVHEFPVRRVRFSCVAISLLTFLVLPVAAFAQAGNFSAGVNYPVPDIPQGLALGAFVTGSTIQDVAVATQDSNVSILIGNGDGTFQTQYTVQAVPTTGPYSGYVTMAIAVGDFNGDGNLDIAVLCLNLTTTAGTINVLLGDGTGHFGAPTVIPLDGMDPVQILAGEFDSNSNSNVDLAVLNRLSESVTILLGNGDGTFSALPDTSIGLSGTNVMATADFNKDGKLDFAVTDSGGVAVLLGNGDGTFQPLVNWALPEGTGGPIGPLYLAVGDFNGDGNPDIVVSANNSTFYVFLGQGDGSFQSPPISSPANFAAGLATADFNSDGKLDLVSNSSDATYDLELFLGNGAGSFSADAVANAGIISSNGSYNVTAMISGDVNGDGYPDLIMTTGSDPGEGAVSVMPNCGLRCTNTTVTSPTSSVFNQAVTFTATVTPANVKATGTPTGTVIFQATTTAGPPATTTMGSATLSNGTATLTYSSLPSRVQYTISANYQGDSNFNSSTSNAQPPPPVDLLVQVAPTTVIITSSPDPSTPGQSVTLTATVTPSTSGVPTGTVTFVDNGNALVAQPLNSSGVATFTTSALSTGTHSITGAYSGDSNFNESTSAAITQIVGTNAAQFAVSASPTSATVSAGASAMFAITLATTPSAKTAIALSCSGLPMGASCSFSPAQITPKGASATTTLTISTTGSGSVFEVFPASPRWPWPALPFAFLGLFALAIVVLARKRQTQKSAIPVLVLLCVFVVLAGAIGCGGNSSAPAQTATPTGTSQITVMASANGQSQTASVSLTVN